MNSKDLNFTQGDLSDLQKIHNSSFFIQFKQKKHFSEIKNDLTSYKKDFFISLIKDTNCNQVIAYDIRRQRHDQLITVYQQNIRTNLNLNYADHLIFRLMLYSFNNTLHQGFNHTILDVCANSRTDLYRLSYLHSKIVGINLSQFIPEYNMNIPTVTIDVIYNNKRSPKYIPFKFILQKFKRLYKKPLYLNENKYFIKNNLFFIYKDLSHIDINMTALIFKFIKQHNILVAIPSHNLLFFSLCPTYKIRIYGYISDLYMNYDFVLVG